MDNRFKISGGLEEVTWASLSFLSSSNSSDSCACVSARSNATDQTTPLSQMQKPPSYPQSHFQKTLSTHRNPHTHVWWRETCMIISFGFVKQSHITTAWWSVTKTNMFDLFGNDFLCLGENNQMYSSFLKSLYWN